MMKILAASSRSIGEKGIRQAGKTMGECKDLMLREQKKAMKELDAMIAFCS